jgi:hypothetical protein
VGAGGSDGQCGRVLGGQMGSVRGCWGVRWAVWECAGGSDGQCGRVLGGHMGSVGGAGGSSRTPAHLRTICILDVVFPSSFYNRASNQYD